MPTYLTYEVIHFLTHARDTNTKTKHTHAHTHAHTHTHGRPHAWQALFMEVVGTAILCYVVFGTAIDAKATPLVSHMAPFAIGHTVFLCHMMLVCMCRNDRQPYKESLSQMLIFMVRPC